MCVLLTDMRQWCHMLPWLREVMTEWRFPSVSIKDTFNVPMFCSSPYMWKKNSTHLCPSVKLNEDITVKKKKKKKLAINGSEEMCHEDRICLFWPRLVRFRTGLAIYPFGDLELKTVWLFPGRGLLGTWVGKHVRPEIWVKRVLFRSGLSYSDHSVNVYKSAKCK